MLMHTIDHLYILLACFNKIFVLLALMMFGNGMLQPFPLLKHALFQGFKIIILLLFFYSVMRWNGKKHQLHVAYRHYYHAWSVVHPGYSVISVTTNMTTFQNASEPMHN